MKRKHINLADINYFHDVPMIPERFHKRFDIYLRDDVGDPDWTISDAIDIHGVWEPIETAILSSAFAANPKSSFVDLGCSVGWFTMLAKAWGLPVIALDLEIKCIECVEEARRHFGLTDLCTLNEWIDADWRAPAVIHEASWPCIVKMDLEGCEVDAVNGLWSRFCDGGVSHCLMEVSPVFNGSYPELLDRLIRLGYYCHVMPEKTMPPPIYTATTTLLDRHCRALHLIPTAERDEWISKQHQFDAILWRPDARWG